MTCLVMISPKYMFCGQERGYLTIVDSTNFSLVSEGKVTSKEDKSHINAITKTATMGLYIIATNKGLAQVKVNQKNQNIMIQN